MPSAPWTARAAPLFAAVFLMLGGLGTSPTARWARASPWARVGALCALAGVALYFIWKHYRDPGA